MSETGNSGVGLGGLIQVAFVVLKLTGTIKWSWFWVLSPSILGFSFILIVLFIAVAIKAGSK